jgi:hypothetical protein
MYGQEECTVHRASGIDALAVRSSVSPAMHSFGAPLSSFRVIEIIKFIENK